MLLTMEYNDDEQGDEIVRNSERQPDEHAAGISINAGTETNKTVRTCAVKHRTRG